MKERVKVKVEKTLVKMLSKGLKDKTIKIRE